ncbi:hypothetical protein J2X72_003110 [Phyllobacterium sp. 1468]|nr:hypothetical protein [Phyllobacterium sp. 1468]
MKASDNKNPRQFYHGTRADLKKGDLISAGYSRRSTDRSMPAQE